MGPVGEVAPSRKTALSLWALWERGDPPWRVGEGSMARSWPCIRIAVELLLSLKDSPQLVTGSRFWVLRPLKGCGPHHTPTDRAQTVALFSQFLDTVSLFSTRSVGLFLQKKFLSVFGRLSPESQQPPTPCPTEGTALHPQVTGSADPRFWVCGS